MHAPKLVKKWYRFFGKMTLAQGGHKTTVILYSSNEQFKTASDCNQVLMFFTSEWITDSSRNLTTLATNNASMGMCIYDALFAFTSLRSLFV